MIKENNEMDMCKYNVNSSEGSCHEGMVLQRVRQVFAIGS